MSLEEQVKNALERALQQAGESLLQQAKEMEPTIVGQAQGPGVEYLWTDTDGSLRISWYISEEEQSGISELWQALADYSRSNYGRWKHVEVRNFYPAVDSTAIVIDERFLLKEQPHEE